MSHLERVAILGEVLSQNVQHPDHLGEDQHSVSSLSQPGQQFVQQHQLPAALHQALKHSSEFQHKDSFKKKKKKSTEPSVGAVMFSSLLYHNCSPLQSAGIPGCCRELRRVHWETYLQMILLCFSFPVLGLFNEETVVAALFQLHNNV